MIEHCEAPNKKGVRGAAHDDTVVRLPPAEVAPHRVVSWADADRRRSNPSNLVEVAEHQCIVLTDGDGLELHEGGTQQQPCASTPSVGSTVDEDDVEETTQARKNILGGVGDVHRNDCDARRGIVREGEPEGQRISKMRAPRFATFIFKVRDDGRRAVPKRHASVSKDDRPVADFGQACDEAIASSAKGMVHCAAVKLALAAESNNAIPSNADATKPRLMRIHEPVHDVICRCI